MALLEQNDVMGSPYEVWTLFSAKFSAVFASSSEKQKCIAILNEIFETYPAHCKRLVPPLSNATTNQNTNDDYIRCNVWLFGQFVAVFLRDYLENQKNKCLEAQIALLQYIGEKNSLIYHSLMRCYVRVLEDLCNTLCRAEDQFQPTVFEWFRCGDDCDSGNEPSTTNIRWEAASYEIRSVNQLTEITNLTLKIFIAQISHICRMCWAVLMSLWRSCLSLLRHLDSDKSLVYHLVLRLIKENQLPDHEEKFDSITGGLLSHIINDIGRICQLGKIKGEEEFCGLLKALGERLRSDICYDSAYLNSLYCLVSQCSVPLAECTQDAILAFFNRLLSLSSDCEADIFAIYYENSAHTINLSLVASILQHSIEKHVSQLCERDDRLVDVFRCSKKWKVLIEQTGKHVREMENKLNVASSKQVAGVLKLARYTTRSAVNACYAFPGVRLIFFGDEIHSIVSSLVKIAQVFPSKKTLKLFFDILTNVLTLPEAKDYDSDKRRLLIALLSFPLPSFQQHRSLSTYVPCNFREKYARITTTTTTTTTTTDDETKQSSITSLMRVRTLESQFRSELCREIFLNPSALVFQSLPIFICNLKKDDDHDEQWEWLRDYLGEANEAVLGELSPFIREIVCALDDNCAPLLTKARFHCRLCDDDLGENGVGVDADASIVTEWMPSDRRRAIIHRLIFSVMTASESARYNVLSVAVKLSNHVCDSEYETFLSLLHDCFTSADHRVRKKIVQITPDLLFRDMLLQSPLSLDYCATKPRHGQFDRYAKSLQDALVTSLVHEDADTQYCCINTVGRIGCIPIEMTLFPCVNLLLNAMLWASCLYAPLAKFNIERVAKAHDLVEEHIYLKYRERIFPLVTHIIVVNFTFYETGLRSLRFDYATIFNTLTQCHILKHLLPHTIQYPRVQVAVDELAELTDMSVAQMLRNGFRHVLLHAMLSESDLTVVEILRLIERETGQKTCDLLSGCVAKVLADLLINYDETPAKVRRCILAVRQLLSGQALNEMWPTATATATASQTDDATIVAFVQHRFFGVMMSLENQLCSDLIPRKARRQIISSLESIIRLMGSAYITSVRFKVLLTLRAIVSTEKATESPSQCVQLWDTFVRSIDRKALGPVLSTIFVSLLPFMGHHRPIIERLFRYLAVENGDAIGDHHLRELYFVESHQCDVETFARIDGVRRTYDDTASLEERLEWLAELCQHEIVEIKLHALERLKRELSANHKRVSLLMLASDSIDSCVCRVLRVLVDGFRNIDEKIHEASGVCLGEFGAIDPSCIPNTVIKVDDAKKYTCYGIDDVEFVLNALTVLCRGYQMAKNNSIMDTFALAIQTTLKAYNVTDAETCLVWSKIPKNLREIIQPFHTTTYVLLSAENESSNNVPHLIYSTRGCTTVQKWAHSWSHFLISLLPANSKEKNILQYFKGVISYDNECMLLFMPHILLNAILCSHEGSHAKIYEEMMSVIRDDKTGGGRTEQQTPLLPQSSTQLVVTEQLSMIRNPADMSMDVICVKTVFRLLDVLYKKYRDTRCALNGRHSAEFKKLTAFLSKFCKYQLAKKSFERKEYARSLLYMEEYLAAANANVAERAEDSSSVDKYLAFLAKTYVYLNDVDNVKGLFAEHSVKLRQPQHVIMLHEITEQFQDAAICYQQLLRDCDEERCMLYEKRMIGCYLSMNQPEMALRFANSFSVGKLKNAKPLDDVKCEALCSLAQYDQLARLTAAKSAQMDENWGVRVGSAVVHFLDGNEDGLRAEIDRIRRSLAKSLHMSSAAFGGYKECYESVVKLHILNEFEKVAALVFRTLNEDEHGRGVEQWQAEFRSVVKLEFEERLHKLQPVSRVLQPVLNTRQALFSVAGELLSKNKPELVSLFDEEIRKCWLKVIEIANRRRNFQLAYSNIVAIDNYQLKGFFIEKAKYYWEKMEQQEALRTLQHGLHFHYKNLDQLAGDRTPENLEDRKICSEALILIGTYNDAMVNTDLQTNLAYFQNAVDVHPQCEKTLLKLAQYQDKMFAAATTTTLPKDRYRANAHLYTQTVQVYGQSLHYGCEFVYQSLSRMLNIWMDFGAAFVADKKSGGGTVADLNSRKIALQDMSRHIESFAQRLPAYYFCTAFSLVMSRISHPLIDCFGQLALIIVRCLQNYPNQILWQFVSLYKAKNRDLHQRYNKIINDSRLAALIPLVKKYQELFEQFSQLAKSSRSSHTKSGNASLTNVVKNARVLLDGAGFDDVLIPAQKFLTIVLPRRSVEDVAPTAPAAAIADQKNKAYNPFPEKMVYISRIKDQIYVYSSLQKPIRVSLVGTDGLDYPMIFKAMDDMRIDCRCMEFNSVVNTYLKRDAEARERALHVRTYTVLPLLDKCGVIEFIPHLHTMRAVNQKMRKSFGLATVPVKQHQCELEDSLASKKESFAKLVALFPPLLHEWYKLEFPNPTSWYAARTAYMRTLAVMSMVGYIVGLGDRHNDNILLDSTNGDVIHVDFNVLFNKGELLAWPERVPFRLTHSMITAMGPLGYEGAFVCTCEIVNRILRNRKEQLLSVLNTFLYDPLDLPLAQPPRSSSSSSSSSSLPSVENLLSKVESRLNGSVTAFKKATSRPLSVEGQTRKLIEEATDKDNLCQMFIGWSAYI